MTENSMSKARTIVLFVAVLFAGTLAGFFLTYAFTIMPGLETTDDRTFVEAFQGLERMFGTFDYGYNWPLMFGYLGLFGNGCGDRTEPKSPDRLVARCSPRPDYRDNCDH
jgi:hypothetical protein